jgi:transcriptional regulator with XRE-family HTH domain
MTFSERLKQIRHDHGEQQQHAAKGIGITFGQLSAYELGKNEPCVTILTAIADYYHVSADYLLGRTEKR